jgi:hypothetical protein
MKKLPNFFIVGAPRAGTTSLYRLLNSHPMIYLSNTKEPYFFNSKYGPKDRVNDINKYKKLFSSVKDEIAIGEASTTYLSDSETPQKIFDFNNKAKIIISLRNPIDRCLSAYYSQKGGSVIDETFHEKLVNDIDKIKQCKIDSGNIVYTGLYSEAIKSYWKIFGKENVKILIFELFFQDVNTSFNDLLKFINIHQKFDFIDKKYNISTIPKNKFFEKVLKNKFLKKYLSHLFPLSFRVKLGSMLLSPPKEQKISKSDEELLKKIYENDIKELKKLLQIDLPWK